MVSQIPFLGKFLWTDQNPFLQAKSGTAGTSGSFYNGSKISIFRVAAESPDVKRSST